MQKSQIKFYNCILKHKKILSYFYYMKRYMKKFYFLNSSLSYAQ